MYITVKTKPWGQSPNCAIRRDKGLRKRADREPDGHSGWAPVIMCGDGCSSEVSPKTATIHQSGLYGRVATDESLSKDT